MKTKQKLENTKGRFFTLETKFGETINAKLISLTDHYVTVRDNNAKADRKLALSSVTRVG